jgi:large subunit ribosomal protein L4
VKVPVYNLAGEEVRKIDISDALFGVPFNEALVHQVMVGQRANARQGTAATKTRGMVAGSTKKLYRQKGTGNARAGSRKSPTRVGGGTMFGPQPRDYRQDVNKKMRRLALKCALSAKVADGELKVLEAFDYAEPRTKQMVSVLAALNTGVSTLIVTPEPDVNVIKSAGNLQRVKTTPASVLNLLDVLNYETIVMTEGAVRVAEKLWGNGATKGEK